MPRVSRLTVAALATAAVAVAGAGTYVLLRRKRSRTPPTPRRTDLGTVAPQEAAPEPAEGYEARWDASRERALASCVAASDVLSYAQATTCALNMAYPEAAPWTDPAVWSPWMRSAAELVEAALEAAASRKNGNPRAWEIAVWLRGRTELDACRAQPGARGRLPRVVAFCAAQRIYPGAAWDRPRAPWQNAMIGALAELAGGPL